MAKTEKIHFILEQVRLCLDRKDFVRCDQARLYMILLSPVAKKYLKLRMYMLETNIQPNP